MSSEVQEARARCRQLRDEINNQREKRAQEGRGNGDGLMAKHGNDDGQKTQFKVKRELKGHYGKIYAMHFHSNSKSRENSDTVVSAAQDGKLMVWNANTTAKRLAIPMKSSWVMTCAISPEAGLVACGGLDNVCSVYRLKPGDSGFCDKLPYQELQRHEGYLSCCRFINERNILTSSGDSTIIQWDIEKRSAVLVFDDHTGDVMSIAVNKDENTFISGSCDATAKLWDKRIGNKSVGNFEGHESDINTVAWFPDYQAFGSGSDDSTMRLFDIRSYGNLQIYDSSRLYCGVMSMDFSRSGKYLFAGYDDEPFCLVWNVTAPTDFAQVLKHQNRVSCLGVNRDGTAVCTGCWDFQLRVWA